jgi:hypothetical protein
MRVASRLPTSVKVIGEYSAIPPSVFDDERKSLISGTENAMFSSPGPLPDCLMYIRRSPFLFGSGLSITPRTTLKMAVFAPMPRPSVRMTANAKPFARARLRRA